ncbi:hypothetical protein JB92DRAFT_3131783 [Gautieria morchelliformis]|nr:hypothetical protein JB92DRAFT_3131783 [Gautieria morchelliformis]
MAMANTPQSLPKRRPNGTAAFRQETIAYLRELVNKVAPSKPNIAPEAHVHACYLDLCFGITNQEPQNVGRWLQRCNTCTFFQWVTPAIPQRELQAAGILEQLSILRAIQPIRRNRKDAVDDSPSTPATVASAQTPQAIGPRVGRDQRIQGALAMTAHAITVIIWLQVWFPPVPSSFLIHTSSSLTWSPSTSNVWHAPWPLRAAGSCLTWAEHTISLVRPVLPGDILLYRAVGLHPGECPGLIEQICVLKEMRHDGGPLFGEPSGPKFPLGRMDSGGSSWPSSPSPSGDKSTRPLSPSLGNSNSSPGGHPDSDTHLPKRKGHLSPGPPSDGPMSKRPKRTAAPSPPCSDRSQADVIVIDD